MAIRNKGVPVTMGASVLALLLVGCSTGNASPEPEPSSPAAASGCEQTFENEKVVFSVSNVIEGFAPLLIAMQSGAFEEVGLDVSIEKIPAADSLPAIAQGRMDGQLTSYSVGNLNAAAEDIDMMWIAPFYELASGESDVLPGYWASTAYVGTGKTPDLTGLEGQLVSSPTGGSGAGGWLLSEALEAQGSSLDDITFTTASGVDALIGLENGAVAGAWLSQPFDQEAAKNPDLRLAATYEPGLNGSALIVGPSLLDRPEVLTKVLQVMAETSQEYLQGDYYKNPDTLKYLAAGLEQDESALGGGTPLVFDATLDMTNAADYVAGLQKFMRTQGSLTYDKDLAADVLATNEFAAAAASCLG